MSLDVCPEHGLDAGLGTPALLLEPFHDIAIETDGYRFLRLRQNDLRAAEPLLVDVTTEWLA